MTPQTFKDVRKNKFSVCAQIKNYPTYMVTGDSMQPTYQHGDYLGYTPVQNPTFLQYGQVYLLQIQNIKILRRIFKGERKGEIMLYADNTDYSPICIRIKDVQEYSLINFTLRHFV